MLPLFAVLLFALMGIAALVVDAGVAFSTQAQLEATGRTLALEHAQFQPRPGQNLDDAWARRRRNLERDLHGAQARGARWDPDTQPGSVVYSREVPARFAFAALLPTTRAADGSVRDGFSVRELLAARDAQGPDASAPSGGLRASGFQPQVALSASAVQPAARVGAVIARLPALGGRRAVPRVPGLAGIALTQATLDRALGEELTLGTDGYLRLGSTAFCVGWAIAPTPGAAVGDEVARDSDAENWRLHPRQDYVPVVSGDCTNDPNRVLAFLNARRDGNRVVPSGVAATPNASATPAESPTGDVVDRSRLSGPIAGCGVGSGALLCVPSLAAGPSS